jgi:Lar family restriction alleviation protein
MSEIKLKRCPFCGGEAKFEINREMGGTQYQVLCTKCPTTVGRYWFWKKEDAINSWNTRKPMQDVLERLEERRFDYYEELEIDIVDGIDQAIEIVKEVGGMNESNNTL